MPTSRLCLNILSPDCSTVLGGCGTLDIQTSWRKLVPKSGPWRQYLLLLPTWAPPFLIDHHVNKTHKIPSQTKLLQSLCLPHQGAGSPPSQTCPARFSVMVARKVPHTKKPPSIILDPKLCWGTMYSWTHLPPSFYVLYKGIVIVPWHGSHCTCPISVCSVPLIPWPLPCGLLLYVSCCHEIVYGSLWFFYW